MQWSDFYNAFWDWSDSARCTHINSLEDIGTGEEVIEVIYEIEDPEVRTQLIRTAIQLGAKFTFEDFQNLEDELPNDVYHELGKHAGFDADNPTYDKTDTSWSHFYDNSFEWDPKTQIAAANRLKQLGKHDEIVDARQGLSWILVGILPYYRSVHSCFESISGSVPSASHQDQR